MSGPGHTGPLVPVYTVEQTAEALGVSRATVHAMLRRGEPQAKADAIAATLRTLTEAVGTGQQ